MDFNQKDPNAFLGLNAVSFVIWKMVWAFVIFLIVAPLLSRNVAAHETESQKQQFHPPETDAERALDRMFHGNSVMTDTLFEITEVAEKKSDRNQCPNGMRGELCEVAHPALTCGAIFHDTYIYRTTSSNEKEATIDAIWPEFETSPAPSWETYKMVKNGHIWMLDGIDCGGVYKFNMSTKELLAKFHTPVSDPEKTLAKILTVSAEGHLKIYEFIFENSSSKADNKKYEALFTKALLKAWWERERALVQENCGGEYKEGEICGMDFDPISCAQDFSDAYFYRTIKEDTNEALVAFSWPDDMVHGSQPYKLIKDRDGWKLDGVDCGEEYRFNLK